MDKIKNTLLQEYHNHVGSDSAKARAAVLKMPYKKDAYLLCCIALTYRDEGMFFKNGKARKRIGVDNMNLAKQYIDKAFKLSPLCRDVLFIKGTIYNALGDPYEAIDCFLAILKSEEDDSPTFNCSGSDEPYIQMLTNDARFQLYRLFHDIGESKISDNFLYKYKKGLKRGINTIYKPLKNYLVK